MSETPKERYERLTRSEEWSKLAEEALERIHVGDLVTAYNVGIHRVVEIKITQHTPDQMDLYYYSRLHAIVHLERVFNKNHDRMKGKSTCDITYCHKITELDIDRWLEEEKEKIAKIEDIRSELHKGE